jgi:hypothetical protein
MKALYWVIGVSIIALGLIISVMLGDAQKTVPKITLSYFENTNEVAQTVLKRLDQEVEQNHFYWIGVEPENPDQLDVLFSVKQHIEKKIGPFDQVIVDSELKLSDDFQKQLLTSQSVFLKENLDTVGQVLSKLESENKKYLFITASVYSNSFIKENQLHTLKEKYKIRPMTISLGTYAANPDEEKDLLFPCSTDDKSGTSNWGCEILNKARGTRRKFDFKMQKPWAGLMDLTGEDDYMLLLRKKK